MKIYFLFCLIFIYAYHSHIITSNKNSNFISLSEQFTFSKLTQIADLKHAKLDFYH